MARGAREMGSERGYNPKRSRRTCSPRYGLLSCRGKSAGASRNSRVSPSPTRNPFTIRDLCIAVRQESPRRIFTIDEEHGEEHGGLRSHPPGPSQQWHDEEDSDTEVPANDEAVNMARLSAEERHALSKKLQVRRSCSLQTRAPLRIVRLGFGTS
jgi:hypothetical protein